MNSRLLTLTEAKRVVLVAMLYYLHDDDGENWVAPRQLAWLSDRNISTNFASRVLDSLASDELVNRSSGTDEDVYTLTEQGILDAESAVAEDLGVDKNLAFASDRIVTFNHNSADYAQATAAIDNLLESIRGDNGDQVPANQVERLKRSLESAKILWSSGELKYLQIKVGVLMVLEDVAPTFKKYALTELANLAISAVKAVIKNRLGVDLDNF